MGHDKLRKFAENETFRCLLQPSAQDVLANGYFNLQDHPVKGRWDAFFDALSGQDLSEGCLSGKDFPNESVRLSGKNFPEENEDGRLSGRDYPGGCAAHGTGVGGPSKMVGSAEPTPPGSPARKDELPIVLELGCGKGEYTVALGERNPEKRYIGVDIKGARLWKGAKYATQKALPNVAFLRTRIELIEAFFGPSEVDEIWLTFSDPQYKRENARLSSPIFLERYRKFLKPGGIVRLKTDSRFLYEYTKAVCAANGLEVLVSTEDLYGEGGTSPETGTVSPAAPSADTDVLSAATADSSAALPASSESSSSSSDVLSAATADSSAALPDTSDDALDEARAVQTFYESMFRSQGYKITYIAFRIDGPATLAAPSDFDSDYWRSVEGDRQLFGRDTAETRRQKLTREIDVEITADIPVNCR